MALVNKGKGLFEYAKYLHDDNHRAIFLSYAYYYTKKVIERIEKLHPTSKEEIEHFYDLLNKRVPETLKSELPDLNNYSLGDDLLIKEYRLWSLKQNLYLNPLNDLGEFSVATHDCLNMPTLTFEHDKPPIYLTFYNQIKQEFAAARFLYYESLLENHPHYSDVDVVLLDTYENAEYSYHLEKTKIAFRLSYSILDKIAFLLNDYLKLGIKLHEVDFKNIWHDKKDRKDLRSFFKTSNNWALRGLYWLSKDIYEKDSEHATVIEPDSKEIAIIRNHLEHKAFKIVSDVNTPSLYNEQKDIAFAINRKDFQKKTLKLLQLVRSAIIYLSLAINQEEKQNGSSKEDFIPIQVQPIAHSTKK